MPRCYPALCAAALLVFCTAVPFVPSVMAKGKKGKASATRTRGKSSQHVLARISRKSRQPDSNSAHSETEYAIVPDEIEVQEYGSSNPSELARWLSPSLSVAPTNNAEPDLTTQAKRRNVKIDSPRVVQIQQALATRGFYSGGLTGAYDEATIDSMRRF